MSLLFGGAELAASGVFLFRVRRGVAKGPRFLLCELFHLAADFGAERAAAALERFEPPGVARDLALEPVGSRGEVPRGRKRLEHFRRRVAGGIRAREHPREQTRPAR